MAATAAPTLKLTPRQHRALEDICDVFCPSGEGLPSARELGVADALVEAVANNPRASERRQLAALLAAWNSPVLGPLGGVGLKSFATLAPQQREQALLAWGDSRLPQRRAVFQALRKGALLFYYMLPGPGGGRNPAWDAIGYDGPLGPLEGAPPKALSTTEPGADGRLECDVVIVGSGAGGGAAAGALSGAGLDVIVVEAGDYYDDRDFEGSELGAFTRFYMGAPAATHDQSVGLVAGACLGGGTVVNYTTSFRTPDEVRAEWAAHGVPAFTSEDYTASLDAVCERLGVNQEYNDPSTREQKLRDGCTALGWHIDAMPRGVRRCAQGKECGYCGLGCRVGAKQSVVKTWLADADERGARLVVRAKVDRVLVEGGAARGISGRTAEGRPLTIRSRAVVVSCGAIHTPALLRRSGLQNQNIGKHLKLHPATAVFGVFDEELKPWEGVMQALYSDQHRDLHGGYGLKYETAANHPHLFIPFSPLARRPRALRPDAGDVPQRPDRGAAARPRRRRGPRRARRRAGRPLQALRVRRRSPPHRDRRRRPDPRGRGRTADLLLARQVGLLRPGHRRRRGVRGRGGRGGARATARDALGSCPTPTPRATAPAR